MGKINELGFEIANLIAAGEVVSRPAGAIKELVENAIDAGATEITVETQNGGILLMRVTDNGCGMDPEDLPLSIRRHATSKIRTAKDLDAIGTMGFRGEALASIAAVSELRIITKTEDAEYGSMMSVSFGKITDISERGAAKGTTVIAENLFANVPARRKFLKRDATETSAVIDCMEKLVLSHPEIAFRLITDGNLRLETRGNGSLKDAAYAVFGKETVGNLLDVDLSQNGIRVHGVVGSPLYTKINRAYQCFFVNKRSIRSPMATNALSQAFTSYIPETRFPVCILFIDLNPLAVDVNVHPTKAEVKFLNDGDVFSAIYHGVRNALSEIAEMPSAAEKLERTLPTKEEMPRPKISEMTVPIEPEPRPKAVQLDISDAVIPAADLQPPTEEEVARYVMRQPSTSYGSDGEGLVRPVHYRASDVQAVREAASRPLTKEETFSALKEYESAKERGEETDIPTIVAKLEGREPAVEQRAEAVAEKAEAVTEKAEAVTEKAEERADTKASEYTYFRILGELFNKYAVVETVSADKERRMLLVDKHAAHERILFEQIRKTRRESSKSGAIQLLAVPLEVSADEHSVSVAKEYKDKLLSVGFETEICGRVIKLCSTPAELSPTDALERFCEILSALSDGVTDESAFPDRFEASLYTVACKAAIKAGREYPPEMLQRIVKALLSDPSIRFCPHGRPVCYELSMSDIDNMFLR